MSESGGKEVGQVVIRIRERRRNTSGAAVVARQLTGDEQPHRLTVLCLCKPLLAQGSGAKVILVTTI